MNPREIAYNSLLSERHLKETLPPDAKLAREIAYGTTRMQISLDYLAKECTSNQKLNLKRKERIIVRMAIYQLYFMDNIPPYAAIDETMKLAKKHCHPRFSAFLNALLRNFEEKKPTLPEKNWGLRYSYPQFFIDELVQAYGSKETETILKAGNQPGKTMARIRKTFEMIPVEDVPEASKRRNLYIQNSTPAYLLKELSEHGANPKTILDLCAAPGGKTIALHDLYPYAELFANDPKEKRLKENLEKYKIEATLTHHRGEEYPKGQKFDLIVIDAPCSNSGVLNKRAEARWRLSEENIDQLNSLQKKLITHAKSLLNPRGQIWYITCSILKKENEELVRNFGKPAFEETILPSTDGEDGGYAAIYQDR